ncbi:MAG: amidohydrolase [Candidatus Schekmanbacteria bacterium]|nr:amidohydrolase [Candidatus Schekmanbacteria bacterium]
MNESEPESDLVITGGTIVTNAPALPRAEALAVSAGKIAAVGKWREVRRVAAAGCRVLDLAGGIAVPGLVDAHGHILGLGMALSVLDVGSCRSAAAVAGAVAGAAAERSDGWILGRGWNHNAWDPPVFPDGRGLDAAASGRAVWLRRADGHAGLASPAALALAGVSRDTPDPPAGRIVRDAAGAPTGVLIDSAMNLVERVIPAAPAAVERRWLEAALACLADAGLTAVHDMGSRAGIIAHLAELSREGNLPVRVRLAIDAGDDHLDEQLARGPWSEGHLAVAAVKLFADGALGSRGAALLAGYADEPGNRGLLLATSAELAGILRRATAGGFQTCIHAIGDGANRAALDAIAAAMTPPERHRLRPRIEHAQVVHDADFARFRLMAVVASMQPQHAASDFPWAPRVLGPDRFRGAYAWRRMLDEGVVVAFGSDFPVEPPAPLEGLRAAVTCAEDDGARRLTLGEALAAYTSGAAFASHCEDRRGRLAPGFDADISLFTVDPAPPESGAGAAAELLAPLVRAARPRATVVAGRLREGRG